MVETEKQRGKRQLRESRAAGQAFLRANPGAFGGGIDPTTGVRRKRGRRVSVAGEGERAGVGGVPTLEEARRISASEAEGKKGFFGKAVDFGKKALSTIGGIFAGEEVGGIRTGLSGIIDPATGEEVRVLAGEVGIGPASGIKSFKDVLTLTSKGQSVISASKVKAAFPAATKSQLDAIITKFNRMNIDDLTKALTKKPLFTKRFIAGTTVGFLTTAAGVDTMFTWYALDNILDGTKFLAGDIDLGIERGTLTPEGARELFSDADIAIDLAINKVETSARFNPFTWAASKLILTGAPLKKAAYELARDNTLATLDPGFVTEEQKSETKGQDIRQAGIIRDFERGFITEEEAIVLLGQTSQEAIESLQAGTATETTTGGGGGGGRSRTGEPLQNTPANRKTIEDKIANQIDLTQEELELALTLGITVPAQLRPFTPSDERSKLGFGLL